MLITGQAVSQALPTVTLSASPTSIPHSKPSTLAWTSANATPCSGTGKGFSPSGPSGSLAVSPGVTTVYGVTCTGAGGSAGQSVTVTVTAAPTLAMGMTVAATPPQLQRRVRPRSAPRRPATRAQSSAVPGATSIHGGRWPSTTTLPAGFLRLMSQPYRRQRRRSFSARVHRASPPAFRRFHGRRPMRPPAAEQASLHRVPQDPSPSRRLNLNTAFERSDVSTAADFSREGCISLARGGAGP